MVLGDAHLYRIDGPKQNSELRLGNKQEDFVRYKASLVEELTDVRVYYDPDRDAWLAQSRRHPFYTDLRRRFYHDGRKTVDSYLLSALDEVGLALWYMDDGHLERSLNCSVKISTCNFNRVEHEAMVDGLWKQFGLRWKISTTWAEDTRYFFLYLRGGDRARFFDLVRSTVEKVPSMVYKLPTEEEMQKVRVGRTNRLTEEIDAILTPEILISEYARMGIADIAKKYGVPFGNVRGRLLKLGVSLRGVGYQGHLQLRDVSRVSDQTLAKSGELLCPADHKARTDNPEQVSLTPCVTSMG